MSRALGLWHFLERQQATLPLRVIIVLSSQNWLIVGMGFEKMKMRTHPLGALSLGMTCASCPRRCFWECREQRKRTPLS